LRTEFGGSDCSDSRDRLYAVLDLLDADEKEPSIAPDYSKTVDQVSEDAFPRFVGKNGLGLLSECELDDPDRWTGPSWVLDWLMALATWQDFTIFASFWLTSWFEVAGKGRLRVAVVQVAAVEYLRPFSLLKGFSIQKNIAMLCALLQDYLRHLRVQD
jgi:hypothetical protein